MIGAMAIAGTLRLLLPVGPDDRWTVLGESVAVVFDARHARITPRGGAPLGAADVRMQVLPAGSVYDAAGGKTQLPSGD